MFGRCSDCLLDRLLNQMVSLATLRDGGKAREIPVFGFINDTLVLGAMDEIERRSVVEEGDNQSPTTEENGKITAYFASTSPAKKPKTAIYLVDSKTRRLPVLPKEDSTIAVGLGVTEGRNLADP